MKKRLADLGLNIGMTITVLAEKWWWPNDSGGKRFPIGFGVWDGKQNYC